MMRSALISALALTVAAPMAAAEPTLIELFVSQNCEACPAAHDALAKISGERNDFLLLTWSVDYWDYLGEADPMAQPIAAERQRAYAEHLRLRGPYTPQTVFDGETHCPGNRPKAIRRELDEQQDAYTKLMDVKRTETGVRINGPEMPPVDVALVRYETVVVDDRVLTNAVMEYKRIGEWAGGEMNLDVTCGGDCVLLFQQKNHGEVLSATRVSTTDVLLQHVSDDSDD